MFFVLLNDVLLQVLMVYPEFSILKILVNPLELDLVWQISDPKKVMN